MNKFNNFFYKGEFNTMMKPFNGFEAKKIGGSRPVLPVGGYVCNILSAKVEEYSETYHVLVLAIDVAEGDYKDFWKKDYDTNDNALKKWRGTYRVDIPRDDGSEPDTWTKRKFGNFIWAVQESNSGFTWDWDEKKLKGKKLGVLYGNKEWEINGRSGWTTEAGGCCSVEDCRAGAFKLPKDKPLKNRQTPAAPDPVQLEPVDDTDDLPF